MNDRGALARLLGAPTEQEGSVNEPRTQETSGRTWNERWLYLDAGGRVERVVFWHRYDLVGVFRVAEDGHLDLEEVPALAAEAGPG